MRLKILLQNGAPKQVKPEYRRPCLLDKAKECVEIVEANTAARKDSGKEWSYLKKLYELLSRKPLLTDEEEEVLYIIEPVIEKYANHDHKDRVDLDAQFMRRGRAPEDD